MRYIQFLKYEVRQFFLSFWANLYPLPPPPLPHFLPFEPLNNPKSQNFEETKKKTGDIMILHLCAINDNHMM